MPTISSAKGTIFQIYCSDSQQFIRDVTLQTRFNYVNAAMKKHKVFHVQWITRSAQILPFVDGSVKKGLGQGLGEFALCYQNSALDKRVLHRRSDREVKYFVVVVDNLVLVTQVSVVVKVHW